MEINGKAIILFDGVCNLCNAAVQLVIRNDPSGYFRFASQQSEAGKRLLDKYNIQITPVPESIILIEDNYAWQHSSASLRIARKLKGGYALLYPLIFIPKFIRDAVYKWIARNRYRWWGQRESCTLPNPQIAQRFL